MRDLEQHFNNMYDKFKLMLYDRALKERGSSSPGDLSLQEVIYMEIIIALGSPTVAEFSRYSKLSAPNTAYRLNKLEERGYIRRTRNDLDKREYRIESTNRYREEYGDSRAEYSEKAETDELKVAEAMSFKKEMFAELHEHMPDAVFVVMSGILLPGRAEYVDMTLDINDQLKTFCEETDYMRFIDAESLTYNRETKSFVDNVESLFNDDQIHLTDASRIVWAENWIKPAMEELNAPTR